MASRRVISRTRRAAQPFPDTLRTPPAHPFRLLNLIVPGIVVVGVLIIIGPALIGHGVLLDVDSLSSRLPFRPITGNVSGNAITCRRDTIDYFPSIAEIKYSLLRGEVPTWTPYEVGGAPLASLPNTSFLTPLALPYFLLPLWLAPAFVKLAEVVVAIAGTVAFLRRRGVSWAGAWVAGFVFATSGFMIMWTNWPHTRVAALIPFMMWAVDRAIDHRRARDAVVLALVFAAMLLGGFPAVTLYTLVVAAVYALIRVLTQYRHRPRVAVRAIATAVGGLALGLGLAAVQLLPFIENLSAAFSGRDKGGAHLPFSAALTMLDPSARGDCRGGVWFGDLIPIEAVGYVGSGAIMLAVLAIGFRRRRGAGFDTRPWLLGTLAVAAMLIWIGGPLLVLWQSLPIIGNNSIIRAQSVVGFLLACLAGLGFDLLVRRSQGRKGPPNSPVAGSRNEDEHTDDPVRPRSKRPIVTALVAVSILIAVTVAAILDAQRDGYLGQLRESLVIPALLLLAAGALVALVYRGPSRLAKWGPVAVVVLVVVQGTLFAQSMLPLSQHELLYPETATHEFLQGNLGHSRYGAGDGTMDASISDWYRLRTPTGHEFTDPRWKDLLAEVDPDTQRSVTYSVFPPSLAFDDIASSPILDRLAVRYWTANPRRGGVGVAKPVPEQGRVRLAADESSSCQVDGGPLWGVSLHLVEQMPVAAPGTTPTLSVRVTAGGETRTGSVLLDGSNVEPGRIRVAVAGEDLPRVGRAEVNVSLAGTEQPRYFAGVNQRLSCVAVRPGRDGDRMRLVFANAGSAIYQRKNALPRIRWASNSRIVAPARQVAALRAGVPDDTVLLDDGSTPAAQGGTGQVAIAADDGGRITADTVSTRQGYLVVADSIVRPGWSATVDGQPAALVRGDHAFAAVSVPEGSHRVELTYTAPGLRAGAIVSSLSLLATAILLCVPPLLARRRADDGLE